MIINMIAAVAQNRAIGYQKKLIYWLPNDIKRFKALQDTRLLWDDVPLRVYPKGLYLTEETWF